MTKKAFDIIFDVKYMNKNDNNYISIDYATEFIENNIAGHITKADLDF